MDSNLSFAEQMMESAIRFSLKTGSISSILRKQLLVGFENRQRLQIGKRLFWLSPDNVMDEIRSLEEANSKPTNTKIATKFSRKTLLGLSKKHWFQASFMPQNLLNEIQKKSALGDLVKVLNSTYDDNSYDGKIIGDSQINAVAHAFTVGNFERRAQTDGVSQFGNLTGEWIIFAEHDGRNFYLTLATHAEPDIEILTRCVECLNEFPQISDIPAFSATNILKVCRERFRRTA